TLIIATHLLADLAQMCDSVAVLRAGRLASVMPLGMALGREGRGRQRLRLELVADPADGRDRAVQTLQGQPGVLDVEEADGGLSFVYEGDRAGLASVLGGLVDAGARVTQFGRGAEHLDEISASLEDEGLEPDASRRSA
nr:hypothetical protein [Chloroflexota bacterium]